MTYRTEHVTDLLSRTPGVLRALLLNLPDPWIKENEGGESWSPFDVVGHLIHGEETDWIPRVYHILDHGEAKTFEPFDRFAQFKKSKGKSLEDLLDTFEQLRKENVGTLKNLELTPAELELKGKHPDFGTVTMAELLATWVVHDLGHIAQIARVMSKRYSGAVGPWKDYLPVLKR